MLVEWVKQRFALCTRKVGAWHFASPFKTWHGSRYCAQCWRNEMTFLPTSTRAWRTEMTGDVSRAAGDAVHVTRIEGLRELFIEVLGHKQKRARRPRRTQRQ